MPTTASRGSLCGACELVLEQASNSTDVAAAVHVRMYV